MSKIKEVVYLCVDTETCIMASSIMKKLEMQKEISGLFTYLIEEKYAELMLKTKTIKDSK